MGTSVTLTQRSIKYKKKTFLFPERMKDGSFVTKKLKHKKAIFNSVIKALILLRRKEGRFQIAY